MSGGGLTAVPLDAAELRNRLAALPRFHLTELPTPLDDLPNLRAELGGPRILVKRDDLTQSALGGNKNRKFQFEVGDALARGCDVLVWGGGVAQSNHARQCAAAARRAGLDVVLVLNRGPHGADMQGNRLLLDLMDVDVRFTGRDEMFGTDAELNGVADELAAVGRRPYVIRYSPLTAVGYVECMLEIAEQCEALDLRPTHVYVASGGGTQAGLEVGRRALGLDLTIHGFSPLRVQGGRTATMAEIAQMCAVHLRLDLDIRPQELSNSDAMVGSAYAEPTPEGLQAIRLLARTEGIFLEPVYTAKAFAALLNDVREDRLGADDCVVFVHTGGAPLLFAYAQELAQRV